VLLCSHRHDGDVGAWDDADHRHPARGAGREVVLFVFAGLFPGASEEGVVKHNAECCSWILDIVGRGAGGGSARLVQVLTH